MKTRRHETADTLLEIVGAEINPAPERPRRYCFGPRDAYRFVCDVLRAYTTALGDTPTLRAAQRRLRFSLPPRWSGVRRDTRECR